jgi:hypothetical protein
LLSYQLNQAVHNGVLSFFDPFRQIIGRNIEETGLGIGFPFFWELLSKPLQKGIKG